MVTENLLVNSNRVESLGYWMLLFLLRTHANTHHQMEKKYLTVSSKQGRTNVTLIPNGLSDRTPLSIRKLKEHTVSGSVFDVGNPLQQTQSEKTPTTNATNIFTTSTISLVYLRNLHRCFF